MDDRFLKAIHQHQNIIHKVCRLYRNNPGDREDLFQDIIYQLWKSFPNFRNESLISSWIYRIALNTAMVIYRKSAIKIEYSDSFPESILSTGDNSTSENEERLYAALQILNDGDKALISLYLDDYSYAEIASFLGISESNVGVKLNRIKSKLKSIV